MPRPITIDDLLSLRWVSDPQPSPDGARVVYTLTAADRDAIAYRSHLWIVPAVGGEPRQFTSGAHRDTAPRWSPDGRWIGFLSDRPAADEKPLEKPKRPKQAWAIPSDGGEARQVTSFRGGVTELDWSPDSTRLVVCARVGPDDAESDEALKDQSDVKAFTRIRYKADGEGLWDGRWKHLFVVPLDGGAPSQVTAGDWDHANPAWSRDGRWIAFVGNPEPDADFQIISDVFVISASGGEPRRLTRSVGPCSQPAWSPDGALVAYVGHDNRAIGATDSKVWVVPLDRGEPRMLTADYDRPVGNDIIDDQRAHPSPGPPRWSADGSEVRFLVGEGATTQLASVTLDGAVRLLTTGQHEIYMYAFDSSGTTVAYALSDPLQPGDVWIGELTDGLFSRRLTEVNRDLLADLALSEPEAFVASGVDGWPVEGWVLRPYGFEEGRTYPVIFEIHGGPHAAYGAAFFHEFQLLAAQGYAVVYTNPRGSRGYGQAFTAATHHDWGGDDYRDLMLALDYALDHFPFLDRDRMGVAGGSYGGYMTNWVVTQTDRFKAAITMRSICNHSAQWGTSDLAYMKGAWEFPGEPWDSPEWYWARSPLAHVANVKTPVLILHSEQDLRCPVSEAEQWFAALKKVGVETTLVRFPEESHDLSRNGKPRHRVERLRWIVTWFERYLAVPSPVPRAEAAVAAGGEA